MINWWVEHGEWEREVGVVVGGTQFWLEQLEGVAIHWDETLFIHVTASVLRSETVALYLQFLT